MKSQNSNIIIPAPFACSKIILMLILIFLSSIATNEAARILNDNNKNDVDFLKGGGKYLLLQSLQWRPIPPPTLNVGTNAHTQITSQVSQRNFVGRKEFAPLPPFEEVAAVPEISEPSTQEVAKTSPPVVPDIFETSPRAAVESSASILEDTDTADQPLRRTRRRPA
ncbi:hypothetical protein H5410_047817 [Solanum commersonii]|uniref:Uncharacterized protein n=1 Tax=Solanum commersonii TaxID=4109 RepID=A0A9J5XIG4_SOLCO|nr:hypothetical protein H5410_047817 [Solanum commersonii]